MCLSDLLTAFETPFPPQQQNWRGCVDRLFRNFPKIDNSTIIPDSRSITRCELLYQGPFLCYSLNYFQLHIRNFSEVWTILQVCTIHDNNATKKHKRRGIFRDKVVQNVGRWRQWDFFHPSLIEAIQNTCKHLKPLQMTWHRRNKPPNNPQFSLWTLFTTAAFKG